MTLWLEKEPIASERQRNNGHRGRGPHDEEKAPCFDSRDRGLGLKDEATCCRRLFDTMFTDERFGQQADLERKSSGPTSMDEAYSYC
jgi:hypothetical protein